MSIPDVYNCIGSTSLGYSSGSLLRVRSGVNTGFGYRTPVGLTLGGTHLENLDRSDSVRGREDLGMLSGNIRGISVK